jgi:hypothetical protein
MRQSRSSTIRVRFVDFWPDFDPRDFFLPLVSSALNPAHVAVVGSGVGGADLEIRSVFPPRRGIRVRRSVARLLGRMKRRPKSIVYSGEAPGPLPSCMDLYLGHLPTDPWARTMYLPQLMASLDWGLPGRLTESARRRGVTVTPEEAAQSRSLRAADRKRFACAFVGNPTAERKRLLADLEEVGPVDIFGSWLDRPVGSKSEVARQYRFMVCPENSLVPGYVTEKPLDSWALGCVPIYSGMDSAGLLNSEAIVDVSRPAQLSQSLDTIDRLWRNDDEWESMAGSALLRAVPTLDVAKQAIRDLMAREPW